MSDNGSIREVKVYKMKQDKHMGSVRLEEAESEGDLLDKYQPSDGFSDTPGESDPLNRNREVTTKEFMIDVHDVDAMDAHSDAVNNENLEAL